MIVSLFAMLLATAQPAPAEEPVVTDTEVQAEVEAEVATPVVEADVAAEAQVAAPAVPAEPVEEEEVAAAAPQEEVVCRRRVIPSERIGQRMRTVRDCRPASEWQTTRRRGS